MSATLWINHIAYLPAFESEHLAAELATSQRSLKESWASEKRLADRITQLEALTRKAFPWVETRMQRHARKSDTEKKPYYQARHKREQDECEGWIVTACALGLEPPEPT